VEVAAWHKDIDQSGGKLDRPGLEALLARIEAGETGGIVVARLDRMSRLGVADALKLVERITEAGGEVAAIDLGVDPTTQTGELLMTLMLALARMERRRLKAGWGVAIEHAIERGPRSDRRRSAISARRRVVSLSTIMRDRSSRGLFSSQPKMASMQRASIYSVWTPGICGA
jgi:DNA invertase Pin-like site-specific DNA recombinase